MNSQRRTAGFTIVELLIGTTVFSIVLLITSGVIVQLSGQFYKGFTKARTQEVARSISDEIANNIRYSKTFPESKAADGDTEGWCIANQRYAFVLHKRLGDTPAALVRSSDCSQPLSDLFGTNGTELIAENMRLVDFNLEPVLGSNNKIWVIRVYVAHGEDEDLCSPMVADSCSKPDTMSADDLKRTDLLCKGHRSSSQYCATAEYTTTVVRRL